jgi:hypothetical protein
VIRDTILLLAVASVFAPRMGAGYEESSGKFDLKVVNQKVKK